MLEYRLLKYYLDDFNEDLKDFLIWWKLRIGYIMGRTGWKMGKTLNSQFPRSSPRATGRCNIHHHSQQSMGQQPMEWIMGKETWDINQCTEDATNE